MISSMIVKIHWLPFGVITWILWIKARPVKLKECFMKPLVWDHLLHVNLLSKNSSCTVAVKHSTCKLCMTCNCENVFRVLWPKSKCYWKREKKKSLMKSLFTSSILPRLHCCISKVWGVRASMSHSAHKECFCLPLKSSSYYCMWCGHLWASLFICQTKT